MRWIENLRLGDENLIKSEAWNPRPEPLSVLVALRNGVESVDEAIADKSSQNRRTKVEENVSLKCRGGCWTGDSGRRCFYIGGTSPNTFCWLFVAGSLTLYPVCNSLSPTNPSVVPRGRGPCEVNSACTYGPTAYSLGAYSWGSYKIFTWKVEGKVGEGQD